MMKAKTGAILTTMLFILLVFGTIRKAQAAMRLQAFHSMQRVMPEETIGGEDAVKIKAARNEYEAFQIAVIAADEKLDDVRVEMSDLHGENGAIIIAFKSIYTKNRVRHSAEIRSFSTVSKGHGR